jgi:hypothetical protein
VILRYTVEDPDRSRVQLRLKPSENDESPEWMPPKESVTAGAGSRVTTPVQNWTSLHRLQILTSSRPAPLTSPRDTRRVPPTHRRAPAPHRHLPRPARAQRLRRVERQHFRTNSRWQGVAHRRLCHRGRGTRHRRSRQLRAGSLQPGRAQLTRHIT